MSDTNGTTSAPEGASTSIRQTAVDAIAGAEAAARAAHEAGICRDAEWSCSYCEQQAGLLEDPAGWEEVEEYTQRVQLGLRPIFYADEARHPDQRPCPSWCQLADDPGVHGVQPSQPLLARHRSAPISVLASRYRSQSIAGRGTIAAQWRVGLHQTGQGAPVVRVDLAYADDEARWRLLSKMTLTVDDARDLVRVVQHLIDQADAAETGSPTGHDGGREL